MNKSKVDRKLLRRERLNNKQKTIVEIVDEEHKDVPSEPVQKPVEKKKRQYKKKVNKE